jgi:hypothetical protein
MYLMYHLNLMYLMYHLNLMYLNFRWFPMNQMNLNFRLPLKNR